MGFTKSSDSSGLLWTCLGLLDAASSLGFRACDRAQSIASASIRGVEAIGVEGISVSGLL